ncbi:MAG: hypothetical protein J6D20_07640 [Clostridia bacterium]|nr:hypothetical protein [Clostridia bacterium]
MNVEKVIVSPGDYDIKELIKIARKKKTTRKYNTRNEFRYNNSKEASGHPHYIFGEKNGKYYSLGITTHPKKEHPYYTLNKSPNPNSKDKNYVQRKIFRNKKKEYGKRQQGWSFDKSDMPIIRHITKSYKKRQNKHKKRK